MSKAFRGRRYFRLKFRLQVAVDRGRVGRAAVVEVVAVSGNPWSLGLNRVW